jgi:hypothetical protein
VIVFDLICAPAGHVFEAWFGSSDDYEAQRQRGLVACPMCGSEGVGKAVMAPRLGAKGNRIDPSGPAATDLLSGDPATVKEMLAAMASVQRQMLASSAYVGESFADEARAIHLGEAEARSIYGKATPNQAQSLIEDGITVTPLPFSVVEPGQEN